MGESDESLGNREPQGKDPGPAQKIHRFAGMLQRQFREIMNVLTRRAHRPAPAKRSRRKGEEERGFKFAGLKMASETRKVRPIHGAKIHMWDAFAWLQMWHSQTPEDGVGFSDSAPVAEQRQHSIPNP